MRYHIVLLLACGSPVLGFVKKYAGPGRRVSRAVCRRALATRDREPCFGTKTRLTVARAKHIDCVVTRHSSAQTRDISATKLSHMQPKNI